MIKRARGELRGISFINADTTKLPLANKQFDTSVAITVLQHITDPDEFQRALNELKRVTKDRIVICDELRQDQPKQVSPFTVLRTVGQFIKGMNEWLLTSKDTFTCVTDEYVLMVWRREAVVK